MAIHSDRKGDGASLESPAMIKAEYSEAGVGEARSVRDGSSTSLHRGLKSRHITMIAIGGAIGTGLIIGT